MLGGILFFEFLQVLQFPVNGWEMPKIINAPIRRLFTPNKTRCLIQSDLRISSQVANFSDL
jgi:hypothetical protein